MDAQESEIINGQEFGISNSRHSELWSLKLLGAWGLRYSGVCKTKPLWLLSLRRVAVWSLERLNIYSGCLLDGCALDPQESGAAGH